MKLSQLLTTVAPDGSLYHSQVSSGCRTGASEPTIHKINERVNAADLQLLARMYQRIMEQNRRLTSALRGIANGLVCKVLVDSALVFLVGVLLNVIKDSKRVDHVPRHRRIFRLIVILTTSGMTTTTGQRKTRRSNPHFSPSPQRGEGDVPSSLGRGLVRGNNHINSTISSSSGLPPLSASSK